LRAQIGPMCGLLSQAYEDQVALVRMAQSQVEACEDELAARNAEIEALQVGLAASPATLR
jgi:hypothetical protein